MNVIHANRVYVRRTQVESLAQRNAIALESQGSYHGPLESTSKSDGLSMSLCQTLSIHKLYRIIAIPAIPIKEFTSFSNERRQVFATLPILPISQTLGDSEKPSFNKFTLQKLSLFTKEKQTETSCTLVS
jgi:hypothetical protein